MKSFYLGFDLFPKNYFLSKNNLRLTPKSITLVKSNVIRLRMCIEFYCTLCKRYVWPKRACPHPNDHRYPWNLAILHVPCDLYCLACYHWTIAHPTKQEYLE